MGAINTWVAGPYRPKVVSALAKGKLEIGPTSLSNEKRFSCTLSKWAAKRRPTGPPVHTINLIWMMTWQHPTRDFQFP
ncbi:hypothetical protein TorRG33x02_033040 [Trema orientale]|uniref:Uncharacterized protein n=1 Tax=Trema orientale TaxID=63057 RepID=A0A2P5FS98_TREOI|nr:hypothetical protein TorRG33x02_033040 [Trema orientale]